MFGCKAPAPVDKEALFLRGVHSDSVENFKLSVAIYDSLLAIDATDYRAFTNRGRAKCDIGDTSGGLADLTKAIALHPVWQAYCSRGLIRVKLHDTGAIKDLTAAIKSCPGNSILKAMMCHHYYKVWPNTDSAIYYADDIMKTANAAPSAYIAAMDVYLDSYFASRLTASSRS